MSRTTKIVARFLFAAVALLIAAAAAIFLMGRSPRFQNYVREGIVAYVENSTGGRVELDTFAFEWWTLTATAKGFTIHGTEPPGEPPLFQAPLVILRLKLMAFRRAVDLNYLGIDHASINIIVFPNNQTNIPTPKRPSNIQSDLKTAIDLAIRQIDITNGSIHFLNTTVPLSIHARDLLANVAYNPAQSEYQGQLILSLAAQYRSPVTARVTIPLVLGQNSFSVTNARIATASSSLIANAVVYDLASPHLALQLNAHLALDELRAASGLPMHFDKTTPPSLDLHTTLNATRGGVAIQEAVATLGATNIEAAGSGKAVASFHGSVSLTEIAHLLTLPDLPAGSVQFSGLADLALPNYSLQGLISASPLSLNYIRLDRAALSSAFQVRPGLIEFSHIDLNTSDGKLTGAVTLTHLETMAASLQLGGLTLARATQLVTAKPISYSGVVSGDVRANGRITAPDVLAKLIISPGTQGIPVSGQLNTSYNSADGVITFSNSVLRLPHSRLELSGQPGREASLAFRSTNLSDLSPALAMFSSSHPVSLTGGVASVDVVERGPIENPWLSGSFQLTNFTLSNRRFDRLSGGFEASEARAVIDHGELVHLASQAHFSASLGLDRWKANPVEPLAADITIQNGQLTDFLTLAGESDIRANGALAATIHVAGTIGNPQGLVDVHVDNGHFYDDSFQQIAVRASLFDRLIDLQTLEISAPAGNLEIQGTFTHPPTDLTSGTIHAHLQTAAIDLSRIESLQARRTDLAGSVQADASLTTELSPTGERVRLSSINGTLKALNIRDRHGNYGDLTFGARSEASAVNVSLESSLAGSNTQLHGAVQLTPEFPFSGNLAVKDLSLQKVAALLSRQIPIDGNANVTGRVSGTFGKPQAALRIELSKGSIYGQPIDRLDGAVDYENDLLRISSLHAITPAGAVELTASYSHSPSALDQGRIDFHLAAPAVNFARVEYIHANRPGVTGTFHLTADGSADLREMKLLPVRLEAFGGIRGFALDGESLGGVNFDVHTTAQAISFNLDSNLAKSDVKASGEVGLQADYPANVKVSFEHVTYAGVKGLFRSSVSDSLDGILEGSANFHGSLTAPEAATGQLQFSRLEVTPAQGITFKNQGTLTLALSRGNLTVQNARITGPSTDVAIGGTIALNKSAPMDLTVKANSNLGVLKTFFPGSVSAGVLDLNASVHGTLTAPALSGRLQVSNASLQLADWPNGVYGANGVILLSGDGGRIQSLTAESGGGKVNITGFFSMAGSTLTYDVHADAHQVRTRYASASVTASATLTLSGTSRSGVLNGTVTISRIGYGQQSDIGSILASATKPPAPPSAGTGPLSAIRVNLRIQTSSDVLFQTTLAQELSATANLTMLGSLQNPGMVGQVSITSGTLVFFSNKYSVNRGVISFYDASTIQPMIDIDLETIAQGVDVNLTVSGPMDDLKLTYRSDPPLRFEDIIALLAAGKTPPDPTIAVNQPVAPDQSAMQMGESALLGAAVANPVTTRLQRVFGVSQLTVAPTFVSGAALPQARVTLQQQVTQNVTFTYSQDLSQTNAELVRIEWELAPRFSAVATRDENGIFSVDFFWKKQFH